MSRRKFLGVAAAGAAIVAGGAIGAYYFGPWSQPSQAPVSLNIQSWNPPYPAVIQQYAVTPFSAAHPNVTVTIDQLGDSQLYPKLVAARSNPPPPDAGGMWNDSWAARGAKDGVWAQINTSNMADSQNIIQQLNPPSGFGIAHGITPFGISYSPKYVSAPKSWTDLLDPKYKGKVAMWDVFFDWLIMEARILGGDEHNLQPAFGAWAKVKDNIGMWIQDFPFLYQALDSGQIWLAPDWGSWSSSAKASGTSVEFTIPQEGATQASAILEISAGLTPQMQTLTEKFYNYYLTSDFQVAQMRQTYYSPTRQGVNIPSDLASNPAIITAQDALSKLVRYDYAYVGAHFTDISNAISQQLK